MKLIELLDVIPDGLALCITEWDTGKLLYVGGNFELNSGLILLHTYCVLIVDIDFINSGLSIRVAKVGE